VRSGAGARELELLDLYRTPTEDNRSLLTLASAEIVAEVRLPPPPAASAFRRLGERRAFSFPLVCVAAARRDGTVHAVAGGVANVPVRIDPHEPLAELPGNPQTMWKRTVLATLTERALADLG
jgi:CO/xanthine dehydrogenase FAD-binding subunit